MGFHRGFRGERAAAKSVPEFNRTKTDVAREGFHRDFAAVFFRIKKNFYYRRENRHEDRFRIIRWCDAKDIWSRLFRGLISLASHRYNRTFLVMNIETGPHIFIEPQISIIRFHTLWIEWLFCSSAIWCCCSMTGMQVNSFELVAAFQVQLYCKFTTA